MASHLSKKRQVSRWVPYTQQTVIQARVVKREESFVHIAPSLVLLPSVTKVHREPNQVVLEIDVLVKVVHEVILEKMSKRAQHTFVQGEDVVDFKDVTVAACCATNFRQHHVNIFPVSECPDSLAQRAFYMGPKLFGVLAFRLGGQQWHGVGVCTARLTRLYGYF